FENGFKIDNQDVFKKDLNEQPIPEIVKIYRDIVFQDVQVSQNNKQIIDSTDFINKLKVKDDEINKKNSVNDFPSSDDMFDFNSSDEEYKERVAEEQKSKIISSLNQNINKHQKVFINKVEMAKIQAEQAVKSIEPIESTNK
ncbi:MAG: hypothetical protein MHPSP_004913, partial [Paramarteilia canceri]